MDRRTPQSAPKFAAVTLKGIKHNSHWINSEDGECEELLNLRYKDGSWRGVTRKDIQWSYDHGCELIHYHPLNDTESSTSIDTTFFYIGYDSTNHKVIAFLPDSDYSKDILTTTGEVVSNITHLNNILIIYTDVTVHFLIWNYDDQEYLELEYPYLPNISVYSENAATAFDAGSYATTDNPQDWAIEDLPDYFSKVVDYISAKKKNGEFVESYVLVMLAYRLFDGSFIMHSQPFLVYCGEMNASYFFGMPEGTSNLYRGYFSIYSGKPKIIIDNSNFTAANSNWSGLISGLSIFMTSPTLFYAYPQNKTGYDWKIITSEIGSGSEVGDRGWEYLPWNKSIKDLIENPVYYRVDEVPWDKLVSSSDEIEISIGFNSDDMNKDASYYLPIDSFTHHRLLSEHQYIYNRRIHIGNVKTIFGEADTHLFTDKFFDLTSEGNGYTADESSFSSFSFYSEVTLQTDAGKRYIVQEFTPNIFAAPGVTPGNDLTDVRGDFLEDSISGSYSLSGSLSETRQPSRGSGLSYYIPFMPIISYPDPRATRIRILAKSSNVYYEICDYQLKAHTFLTLAYCATNYNLVLNDWTTGKVEEPGYYGYMHDLAPISTNIDGLYAPTTIATDNRYYLDENRLQVSRIDNPFVGEAKHSYQIGGQDSRVLGLATSAVQVSDGQYGEFPLFIFTTEGVYTLKQGTDPAILYSSISPVSKERLLPGSICEINYGILYCTVDGIKLLSGTDIKNISDGILFEPDNPLFQDAEYQSLIDGTTMPIFLINNLMDETDIRSYIQGCKLAYDSYENEIIVSNTDYNYSYIFNVRANTWHKVDQVWEYFIMIEGKYYGVNGDYLYSMEEATTSPDVTFFIHTKPIKLGSQGFKQIQRVVVRQHLEGEAMEINYNVAAEASTGNEQDNPGSYYIDVLYPYNGAQWELGHEYQIFWDTDCPSGEFEVYLCDGTTRIELIGQTTNNVYKWTIPTNHATGTGYKIEVYHHSTETTDYSEGTFSIVRDTGLPSANVVYPNGGETVYRGYPVNIRWQSTMSEYIIIELWKGGAKLSTISGGTSNDGVYTWTIPADTTLGTDYKIKIKGFYNTSTYDLSDADFTIADAPEGSGSGSTGIMPIVSTTLEAVYLYGSVDGTEYKLLRGSLMTIDDEGQILRVVMPFPHVAIRYLVVVIAGRALEYRFSHIEITYQDVMHNKLR